jgi:hypothetical protein
MTTSTGFLGFANVMMAATPVLALVAMLAGFVH